jgi:hypothetical protein
MTGTAVIVAVATAFIGVLMTWIRVRGTVEMHKTTQITLREIVATLGSSDRHVSGSDSSGGVDNSPSNSESAEGAADE